jgi:hypothetical protein
MNTFVFEGIIPALTDFNKEIFLLLQGFPPYFYKIAIGVLYGLLLGFCYSFWKKQITFYIISSSFSLWFLQVTQCLSFNWPKIYFILGLSASEMKWISVVYFIKSHFFEIGISLAIIFIFNRIVNKIN